ncbi:MAG: hypothetical protein AAGF07_03735 [Patescibacteria group bacterium]
MSTQQKISSKGTNEENLGNGSTSEQSHVNEQNASSDQITNVNSDKKISGVLQFLLKHKLLSLALLAVTVFVLIPSTTLVIWLLLSLVGGYYLAKLPFINQSKILNKFTRSRSSKPRLATYAVASSICSLLLLLPVGIYFNIVSPSNHDQPQVQGVSEDRKSEI